VGRPAHALKSDAGARKIPGGAEQVVVPAFAESASEKSSADFDARPSHRTPARASGVGVDNTRNPTFAGASATMEA
jgi:hypothetical protein